MTRKFSNRANFQTVQMGISQSKTISKDFSKTISKDLSKNIQKTTGAEFSETPNRALLTSVMKKYPVSVQKPYSITSQSETRQRKMNLSEFCNSLIYESYYCIPKMIKDNQDIKWVWK
jgi:hypothetical protein